MTSSLGLSVLFCEMGMATELSSGGEKASLSEAFTMSWVYRQHSPTNCSDILVTISLFSTRLSLIFQIFKAHFTKHALDGSREARVGQGAARQEERPCV